MTQDPRRLTEDPAGPELARALREAQGNVLSPEAMDRVRAGLLASGIALRAGPVHAPPSAPQVPGNAVLKPLSWVAKGLTATSLKVGLAALGLALLAGAVWRLRPPSREVAAPAIVPASSPPVAEAAPAAPSPPTDPDPETPARPAAPSALPAGAPLRTVEPARAKATAPPSSALPPSAPPSSVPSPREGTLLLQARRKLDTDPAQALVLVQAHEKEFPTSQLALERARIAAEARHRLGQ